MKKKLIYKKFLRRHESQYILLEMKKKINLEKEFQTSGKKNSKKKMFPIKVRFPPE